MPSDSFPSGDGPCWVPMREGRCSPLLPIIQRFGKGFDWAKVSGTALYKLSKRISKHFVIQIKVGIFPGQGIIIEHGKMSDC